MPVYNEKGTIREIVRRVQAVDLEKEIIIVDDASADGTADELAAIAREHDNIRVFRHERNRGKGAALRTGFAQVAGDVVIIQDADLEYNPQEYHKLLEPIIADNADAVFGSRFLGGPRRVLYFWHYVGNWFLTLFSNALNNLNVTDMETCYKVFKTEALRKLKLRSNRFAIEPELTAKIARARLVLYEVPITYHGRTYAEGKKIGWKDGLVALWAVLFYRFFD